MQMLLARAIARVFPRVLAGASAGASAVRRSGGRESGAPRGRSGVSSAWPPRGLGCSPHGSPRRCSRPSLLRRHEREREHEDIRRKREQIEVMRGSRRGVPSRAGVVGASSLLHRRRRLCCRGWSRAPAAARNRARLPVFPGGSVLAPGPSKSYGPGGKCHDKSHDVGCQGRWGEPRPPNQDRGTLGSTPPSPNPDQSSPAFQTHGFQGQASRLR